MDTVLILQCYPKVSKERAQANNFKEKERNTHFRYKVRKVANLFVKQIVPYDIFGNRLALTLQWKM
jgi:hypothetical protein